MTKQSKNEVLGWLRTMVTLVAIGVATGKLMANIQSNTQAIQANTCAIQNNAKKIQNIEVVAAERKSDMAHIQSMLSEVRADVKRLVQDDK